MCQYGITQSPRQGSLHATSTSFLQTSTGIFQERLKVKQESRASLRCIDMQEVTSQEAKRKVCPLPQSLLLKNKSLKLLGEDRKLFSFQEQEKVHCFLEKNRGKNLLVSEGEIGNSCISRLSQRTTAAEREVEAKASGPWLLSRILYYSKAEVSYWGERRGMAKMLRKPSPQSSGIQGLLRLIQDQGNKSCQTSTTSPCTEKQVIEAPHLHSQPP